MNDPEAQSGLKWIYQSIRTIKNIVSDINDQGLKFIIRLQSSRLNSKPLFHSPNGSTRLDRKIYPSNDIGKSRILWKKIFSFRIPNSVPSDRLIKLNQKLSKIVVSISFPFVLNGPVTWDAFPGGSVKSVSSLKWSSMVNWA